MTAATAIDTHTRHDAPGADELEALNRELAGADATARVAWALAHFPGRLVLSSSFGAQAAVMLHLVTRQRPDIPVVLIDTGYLFAETYRFVDELTERLALNLHVYRSPLSAAWQEARYGRLWEQGVEGIERYNRMNKVEPMQRALSELGADAWLAGLRRQQASSRAELDVVAVQNGRYKVHPIIDWSDRDVYYYLRRHGLPYHPLWHEGYVSIGDWHTSRPLSDDLTEEQTRFFGLKRECGLHEHV
ncbi:Phosphoadenosine phosphosulfate reductase [wastewater metagenome]|uniref:Phosphoadenosine phosphosulfate reductase n=2 Tax=unclassified sequences TaxID=12908 RepID=A0A5B8RCT0_9ZZZZ|nr:MULTISPECIES: phosphoadenylyl-sulfate reductase [Arhodomonas]MCS4502610.1 phosphoadenylyl-sulfate reductase [Arhodomonas aquaeolei]QEA05294.1 phosphoadenosine phosphosulfate reductase [uncultured organism]